ncbi:hypothetical protein [Winogradskyella vidalii]|uniref:hypothetical protein n=1 Tax=Winogradskyella vidalii TaxID=2615024 RepID=UPI0015CA648C|nr:hypothetical protein [Winogradskyella vidalii]
MIKDFLISFRDNFKEKTRNPFLGTYLIVWIIRNWDLIYTLFNFDSEYKLANKIAYIKSYYSENGFIENLFTSILWAFGLLILTYILLAISRFITNYSEKRITPWIYKITDSKSIVLKETYEKLRNENSRIETKLESEREIKKRLMIEISELENEIDNLKMNNSNIENELPDFDVDKISLDNEVEVLLNKIKRKKLIDKFITTINRIGEKEHGWIDNAYWNESTEYFIKLGLFSTGQKGDSYSELELTEVGSKVLRRARLEIE